MVCSRNGRARSLRPCDHGSQSLPASPMLTYPRAARLCPFWPDSFQMRINWDTTDSTVHMARALQSLSSWRIKRVTRLTRGELDAFSTDSNVVRVSPSQERKAGNHGGSRFVLLYCHAATMISFNFEAFQSPPAC